MTTAEARAWEALCDVLDPEWPISIVDLGLVRGISVVDGVATVSLTFTSVGCPCIDWICDEVTNRLRNEEGIDEVQTVITWDAWSAAHLSDEARRKFLEWGVAVPAPQDRRPPHVDRRS